MAKDENADNENAAMVENGTKARDESSDSDDSDDSLSNLIPTPPDGGWGWVVVGASLLCNIIVDGIGYSFGIFLPEFITFFQEPRSKVSLIGSLLCGTYLCAGPVVSGLTNKFGCRPVTIVGSIIATIAFLLATLSPNVDILIITYGILGGFGFGMIYLPSIVSVGYYFEKKRAVATGIAVCGSGIGTFIFAPLTKYLLDELDWKNALFILAGIVFNGCVCGCLMRPLEPKKKAKKKKKKKIAREKTVIDRIKEQANKSKRKHFTSESSGIGPTDTTEILEKVREAKLHRQQILQETESEICSLPSQYFEKDKPCQRQDSTSSKARSHLQKLSFSDRSDTPSNPGSPTATSKAVVEDEGIDIGADSLPKVGDDGDGQSEMYCSVTSSPIRSKSPEFNSPDSTIKHRGSSTRSGSQLTEKVHLSNGLQGYEVQPLIKVGHGGVAEVKKRSGAVNELIARSGVGATSGSRHLLGASMRSITSKDFSRPLYKQDIFYSGSVVNIQEFKSQPDMASYITSITSVPDIGRDLPDGRLHRLCACLPKPVVDVMSEMLDFSLFSNYGFMCICLGNVFAMIGYYVPYVYLVDRALLLGIDKTQATFLLSVIGITNTIGRILSGVLADMKWVNSLMLNNISMLIAGFAIVITPAFSTYAPLVVIASVYGLCTAAYISLTSIIICDLMGLAKLTNAFGLLTLARGISSVIGPPIAAAFISLTSIILCELLGIGKLTNAFGLLCTGRGIAAIIGPPMAGAVYAQTGNYDASFYLGGCLFFVGTLLHFALYLPCMKRREITLDIEFPTVDADDVEQEMTIIVPSKGEETKT